MKKMKCPVLILYNIPWQNRIIFMDKIKKTVKKILKVLLAVMGVMAVLIIALLIYTAVDQKRRAAEHAEKLASMPKEDPGKYIGKNGIKISGKSEEELEEKYKALMAGPDDDVDRYFANDYSRNELTNMDKAHDSCAYRKIFGYDTVSREQLLEALDANQSIPERYKEFIRNYIDDWLRLWPDSDMTVFYNNLFTLEVVELSSGEMQKESLSQTVAAQYLKKENRIQVLDTIDLEQSSDDYIILAHELTHSARNNRIWNADMKREIAFSDGLWGEYADEAIITDLVYEMQGLNQKANKYTLQSSYFRIILDCIDFDGADYMNHSASYLAMKMDEFMDEDEPRAWRILAKMDAEGKNHYQDYIAVDYSDYTEIHEYVTKMYCKKHLKAGMSKVEADKAYEAFMEDITYWFDKMKYPYNLEDDAMRAQFEACCRELDIK